MMGSAGRCYSCAPVIRYAKMDPMGISITVIFDQSTNMAGMSKTLGTVTALVFLDNDLTN
jgi:hypothetical protein